MSKIQSLQTQNLGLNQLTHIDKFIIYPKGNYFIHNHSNRKIAGLYQIDRKMYSWESIGANHCNQLRSDSNALS